MLEVRGIFRRFGGLQALANVSLGVEAGEIVALIGPNGAGKTTLFSIISGFQRADAGDVRFDGHDISTEPAHRISHRGLVRTFQIARPFSGLSVLENIAVGAHMHHRRRARALAKAAAVGERLGLGPLLERPAEGLTVANRKRLEVARALATSPRLLLLDEVFAGLNPTEIDEVMPVITLLREQGLTILLTEHVMQAVRRLADRTVVLANGTVIATGTLESVSRNPAVIEAYLGRRDATPEAGHDA